MRHVKGTPGVGTLLSAVSSFNFKDHWESGRGCTEGGGGNQRGREASQTNQICPRLSTGSTGRGLKMKLSGNVLGCVPLTVWSTADDRKEKTEGRCTGEALGLQSNKG